MVVVTAPSTAFSTLVASTCAAESMPHHPVVT